MSHMFTNPREVTENSVNFWQSRCNCGHLEERKTQDACIEMMSQHASLEQDRVEADPDVVRFCPRCGAGNLDTLRVSPEEDDDAADNYPDKYFSASCKECYWTGSIIPDASMVGSSLGQEHNDHLN